MGYGLYVWADDGTPRIFDGSHLLRWYGRYQLTLGENESKNIYIPEFNITTWAIIIETCDPGISIYTYPGRINIRGLDKDKFSGRVSFLVLKGDGV